MSENNRLIGIYRINKDFNESNETFVYGTDKGSLYVYEELKKKGIHTSAFCCVSARAGEKFEGLSVMDYNELPTNKRFNLVLPVYDAEIHKKIMNNPMSSVFLYSIAYQNDILWPEDNEEILKPFYQIEDGLLERDIVLYGAGDIGHRLFVELLNYEIPVKYFCDSDESKVGLKLMNKPVISVEELIKLKDACNIVIASRDYADEIESKLRLLGINNLYYYNG